MRFLPVIDLMGGVVVRGVAGERERYQPLHSWLCPDADPATLARAFVERLGFHDVYVADLDAIAGQSPAWSVYEQIADAGLRLWLDAGVGDVARAAELAAWSSASRVFEGVLVGSESLRDIGQLPPIIDLLGRDRFVLSLDLRHGEPIVAAPQWRGASAEAIVEQVVVNGCRRLLVLDLAAVGVGGGPTTLGLCRALTSRYPVLSLLSGGGVRDRRDAESLAESGCQRILIASALHLEETVRALR